MTRRDNRTYAQRREYLLAYYAHCRDRGHLNRLRRENPRPSETYTCQCGSRVMWTNVVRHRKTKTHLKWVDTQEEDICIPEWEEDFQMFT